MRKKSLLMIACVCAAMVMVSQADAQWFLFQNPLLGKQAKEFSLKSFSGTQQSLSVLRNGRPAILFFWATWCPHCVEQLKDLKQHADDFAQKDIQLILVDLDEDEQTIKNFMIRRGLSFDVLIDVDGRVADDYGVQGVPTYIFINSDGVVKAVEHVLPENYERILLEK